ncbi:hypothetical protein, partial [Micromonospora violae]|uniref:hypothetical protein n=1 Tax=Micromonospora violae TaxID=1278207 RepID=UPI0033D7D038
MVTSSAALPANPAPPTAALPPGPFAPRVFGSTPTWRPSRRPPPLSPPNPVLIRLSNAPDATASRVLR